jgi:DNA-binding GntR family transcriptional regulator
MRPACLRRPRATLPPPADSFAPPPVRLPRRRALHQHPELAEAIIFGDPVLAASLAAKHFSLTEEMLSELHTQIRLRSGGDSNADDQGQ